MTGIVLDAVLDECARTLGSGAGVVDTHDGRLTATTQGGADRTFGFTLCTHAFGRDVSADDGIAEPIGDGSA